MLSFVPVHQGSKQTGSNNLRIYFGSGCADIYAISYVLSDLYQLWAFSKLVENHDMLAIKKHFGEKRRYINRYIEPLREYRFEPRIIDIRRGSVELIVGGAAVLTTVVVGVATVVAQEILRRRAEQVIFNVDPKDQYLEKALGKYAEGTFGKGPESVDKLLRFVQIDHYNSEAVSENVYNIYHVTRRYGHRMARTLRRNN